MASHDKNYLTNQDLSASVAFLPDFSDSLVRLVVVSSYESLVLSWKSSSIFYYFMVIYQYFKVEKVQLSTYFFSHLYVLSVLIFFQFHLAYIFYMFIIMVLLSNSLVLS